MPKKSECQFNLFQLRGKKQYKNELHYFIYFSVDTVHDAIEAVVKRVTMGDPSSSAASDAETISTTSKQKAKELFRRHPITDDQMPRLSPVQSNAPTLTSPSKSGPPKLTVQSTTPTLTNASKSGPPKLTVQTLHHPLEISIPIRGRPPKNKDKVRTVKKSNKVLNSSGPGRPKKIVDLERDTQTDSRKPPDLFAVHTDSEDITESAEIRIADEQIEHNRESQKEKESGSQIFEIDFTDWINQQSKTSGNSNTTMRSPPKSASHARSVGQKTRDGSNKNIPVPCLKKQTNATEKSSPDQHVVKSTGSACTSSPAKSCKDTQSPRIKARNTLSSVSSLSSSDEEDMQGSPTTKSGKSNEKTTEDKIDENKCKDQSKDKSTHYTNLKKSHNNQNKTGSEETSAKVSSVSLKVQIDVETAGLSLQNSNATEATAATAHHKKPGRGRPPKDPKGPIKQSKSKETGKQQSQTGQSKMKNNEQSSGVSRTSVTNNASAKQNNTNANSLPSSSSLSSSSSEVNSRRLKGNHSVKTKRCSDPSDDTEVKRKQLKLSDSSAGDVSDVVCSESNDEPSLKAKCKAVESTNMALHKPKSQYSNDKPLTHSSVESKHKSSSSVSGVRSSQCEQESEKGKTQKPDSAAKPTKSLTTGAKRGVDSESSMSTSNKQTVSQSATATSSSTVSSSSSASSSSSLFPSTSSSTSSSSSASPTFLATSTSTSSCSPSNNDTSSKLSTLPASEPSSLSVVPSSKPRPRFHDKDACKSCSSASSSDETSCADCTRLQNRTQFNKLLKKKCKINRLQAAEAAKGRRDHGDTRNVNRLPATVTIKDKRDHCATDSVKSSSASTVVLSSNDQQQHQDTLSAESLLPSSSQQVVSSGSSPSKISSHLEGSSISVDDNDDADTDVRSTYHMETDQSKDTDEEPPETIDSVMDTINGVVAAASSQERSSEGAVVPTPQGNTDQKPAEDEDISTEETADESPADPHNDSVDEIINAVIRKVCSESEPLPEMEKKRKRSKSGDDSSPRKRKKKRRPDRKAKSG